MKILISSLIVALAVSCSKTPKPTLNDTYKISCNPVIEHVTDGIKLSPNIQWSQSSIGKFSYTAHILHRESSTGIYRMGESIYVSDNVMETGASSCTYQNTTDIDEMIVLITVHEKDDRDSIVERLWCKAKIVVEQAAASDR